MALYQSCETFRAHHPSNSYEILAAAKNNHPGRSTSVGSIGDDINSVNELGETPLFAAIRGGVVADLPAILRRNPDLNPHLLRAHPLTDHAGVAGHFIVLSLQDLIADHVLRGNDEIARQIVHIFHTRANKKDYAAVYGEGGTCAPLYVPSPEQAHHLIDKALHSACTRNFTPRRYRAAILAVNS